jgi:hypothetical protein
MLRFIVFVAIVFATIPVIGYAAPSTPPTAYNVEIGPHGDANCDGKIDDADALALLRYVAGLPATNTHPWPSCAIGVSWRVDVYDVMQASPPR